MSEEKEFKLSVFWFSVLHVMGRIGLFKPYCYMIEQLLDHLGEEVK